MEMYIGGDDMGKFLYLAPQVYPDKLKVRHTISHDSMYTLFKMFL